MKVTILDTKTGERNEVDNYDAYWWAEGNGACDCNRRIFMGEGVNDSGTCEGCHRFLIVAASTDQYSLRELNDSYPDELLKAHGI